MSSQKVVLNDTRGDLIKTTSCPQALYDNYTHKVNFIPLSFVTDGYTLFVYVSFCRSLMHIIFQKSEII